MVENSNWLLFRKYILLLVISGILAFISVQQLVHLCFALEKCEIWHLSC